MIKVDRLTNGLTVATDEMQEVETASLGIWVGAGTRHETRDINGAAHFLEHMAFKGTRRRSARAIAEEIEAVGGHLNAYTAREQTAYYAKVLRADAPLALDILADILCNSTFDPAEVQRERTVILQEIGQAHDTPDDIVFDYFQETAFPAQPMGWPVLGPATIVQRLTRDELIGYMRRSYGAQGMILAAAGNVPHDRMLTLAEDLLGGVAAEPDLPREAARYTGGDFRQDKDLEQVHFLLGFEGVRSADPEFYAQSVLSTLLGGGMSSRLFQEIREIRGLAYSVYSFASSYDDSGLFGVYAGTGAEDLPELIPVLCGEITRCADTLTAEEVQRAKTQLKAGLLMGRESTSARCEQLASHLQVFGRPLDTAEIVAAVDAVDETAVRGVLDRLLRSKPTVTALGPIAALEDYDAIARRLN